MIISAVYHIVMHWRRHDGRLVSTRPSRTQQNAESSFSCRRKLVSGKKNCFRVTLNTACLQEQAFERCGSGSGMCHLRPRGVGAESALQCSAAGRFDREDKKSDLLCLDAVAVTDAPRYLFIVPTWGAWHWLPGSSSVAAVSSFRSSSPSPSSNRGRNSGDAAAGHF